MREEDHSIWASRPAVDANFGFAMPQRRARAGTLPSRLPSRLAPRLDTSAAPPPPLAHLGSLALVSPNGSDIVYDSPPSSRSAVGQQPDRRSPPLQSIPEPFPTIKTDKDVGSTGSAISSGPSSGSGSDSLGVPTTPMSARSRAGSMNSARTFNPFGNSIWNSAPLEDALSPFPDMHKQLGNAGGASRMRSYTTMDAPPAFTGISQTLNPTVSAPGSGLQGSLGGPLPRPRTNLRGSLGSIASNPFNIDPEHNLMGDLHPPPSAAPAGPGSGLQLGDYSSVPTAALYISNVPPHVSAQSLHSVFGNFGRIDAAGVLPDRRSAYVVFASTIQAIEAQATANGAELYVGNGPSAVAFAQIVSPLLSPPTPPMPGHSSLEVPDLTLGGPMGGAPAAIPVRTSPHASPIPRIPSVPAASNVAPITIGGAAGGGGATAAGATVTAGSAAGGAAVGDDTLASSPISVAYVLQSLNAPADEVQSGVAHLKRAAQETFDEPLVPLSEVLPGEERVYNAAVLRDLRRKLEAMPPREVEELALDMLHELPGLASDYIGNTVVQLVFERSGSDVRDMMLRRLVPVFAATGTHKNGTWAVQKMIDLARGARQYELIRRAIQPHLVSLLLDQFGNYVVQACLKFGAPYNDFVYSGVASTLARVAPNRFGARAVRGLLESEHTTLANRRLVATAIVQHLPALALSANGCLLVSWLLDGFERIDPAVHARTQTLVASQLVPRYLGALCVSKIGSGIVVKLASSQRVFDTLVAPLTDEVPAVLVEVLEDPTGQGPATIYRLLTSVFPLNSLERQVTVNKIRMCLLRPGAVVPNHKRLLEECGLEMLPPTEPLAG